MQAGGKDGEDEDLAQHLQGIVARRHRHYGQRRHQAGGGQGQGSAGRPIGRPRVVRRAAGRVLGAPHQPPGPHHQDDGHDQEQQHQGDLGEDEDAEGLQLGDEDGGEEGAGYAAHAADDDDDEGLGDDVEVHEQVGRLARQLHRAAQPGQEGAEEENAGEQPLLVDA